jgi:hypothetical protein
MIEEREVVVADAGFEDYFEYLNGKIENIETEKAVEKEKVLAEVDAKYEVRLAKFTEALAGITHTEIVEVEVEETEIVEDAPVEA